MKGKEDFVIGVFLVPRKQTSKTIHNSIIPSVPTASSRSQRKIMLI